MSLKKWNRISNKTVTENSHWSYMLDEFEIEGGHRGEYHYVHTNGSSMVIPVTESGKLILINQFRYLNQKESIEFPCGSICINLSPEENAIKELREETGFTAQQLIKAGEFSPYTGASDEICTVFIGTNLLHSPLPNDDTEEFEIMEISFEEVDKLISQNIIWDGMTISAWTIAKNKLKEILNKN